MPTTSAEGAGPRPLAPRLVAVAAGTAAWCALAIPAPATLGAHVAVDEPQYLLSATSLAEDLDLDIADELASERWRTYHEGELPEQTAALAGGRRVSPHDPLLPALLAVPMALGGWVAAKAALALVAGALAATLVWTAVRRLDLPVGVATASVLCFSLAPPLAVYGTQVYPELPAALAVAAAVAAGSGPLRRGGLSVTVLAVSALPWLSVKYAPVAGALSVVALWRLWSLGRRRAATAVAGALGLSGVVFAAVHLGVYGALTPYVTGDHFGGDQLAVTGTAPNPAGRSRRLVGLLVDRDFGLVPWQPAWLLAVVALGALLRARPPWWPSVVLPLAAGWATAAFVALTMHGFWWPGRQTVVVLPLATLAVAWWVARSAPAARALVAAGLAAGALAFGWLVVDGLAGRTTWVFGFDATGNPLVGALRPLLPDLRTMAATDAVLLVAWALALAALAGLGGRGAPAPGRHGLHLLPASAPPPTTDRRTTT